MNEEQLYRDAFDKWGDRQILMAVEELSECCAQLTKVANGRRQMHDLRVVDEVVDATIMLEQMRLLIPAQQYTAIRESKLRRLRAKIAGKEE